MGALKDSEDLEIIKNQYDRCWDRLLETDEEKALKIIEHLKFKLLSPGQKVLYCLKPFRTHLTWAIPLTILVVTVLMYAGIVWIALWVE